MSDLDSTIITLNENQIISFQLCNVFKRAGGEIGEREREKSTQKLPV